MATKTFIYAFAMILLIIGAAQPANGWEEFAVRPSTDDQGQSDISGTLVVWHQFVSEYGDYDIYMMDVNEAPEPFFLIIGDANDQMNPAVFDDLVVWQDYIVWEGQGDWDIRVVDISDRGEPQIFAVTTWAENDERRPAIHGNVVVWEDGSDTDLNVYGADITDLTAPLEFPIATYEFNQQRPAIYRTTVVWEDAYFGDWDIFAADISEPNNPTEIAVAAIEASQTNPDIDGNIIVWQDNRHGNWDIFGYNLTTRREFQITDDRNDQTNPAISGNIVVWEGNRDGHAQIYAVVLDGPAIAQCASKIPGDLNSDCKVDFADFTLMASHWLECNLDPQEACFPL